jgi:hypothetical protein
MSNKEARTSRDRRGNPTAKRITLSLDRAEVQRISLKELKRLRDSKEYLRTRGRSGTTPRLSDKRRADLLNRLVADHRINEVLRTLNNRARGVHFDTEEEHVRTVARNVFWLCEGTLAQWKRKSKLTPAEIERRLSGVRAKAVTLAVEIAALSEIAPVSIVKLLVQSEIEEMYTFIAESLYRGIPTLPEDWIAEDLLSEMPPMSDFKREMRDVFPQVSKVLKRFAQLLSRDGWTGTPIPQPNARRAKEHFFARSVASAFKRRCGSSLPQTVSILTNVVFALDDSEGFSESMIRSLLKAR